MAYGSGNSKWEDYPSTNTPITSERLNRMEQFADDNKKRLDNLAKLPAGSTTGDAELADIRVGADGKIYDNAGEAVRAQNRRLKQDIAEQEKIVTAKETVEKSLEDKISAIQNEIGVLKEARVYKGGLVNDNKMLAYCYYCNGGKFRAYNISNSDNNPSQTYVAYSSDDTLIAEYSSGVVSIGTKIEDTGLLEFPSDVKMVVFFKSKTDTTPISIIQYIDQNGEKSLVKRVEVLEEVEISQLKQDTGYIEKEVFEVVSESGNLFDFPKGGKFTVIPGENGAYVGGKNLLVIDNIIQTKNGITVSVTNGVFTVQGTAEAETYIYIPFEFEIKKDFDYTFAFYEADSVTKSLSFGIFCDIYGTRAINNGIDIMNGISGVHAIVQKGLVDKNSKYARFYFKKGETYTGSCKILLCVGNHPEGVEYEYSSKPKKITTEETYIVNEHISVSAFDEVTIKRFGKKNESYESLTDKPDLTVYVKNDEYEKTKEKANKAFDKLNEYGNSLFNTNLPDSEVFQIDEKPFVAKYFADRTLTRSKYLSANNKSIFWDNVNGSDDNDGLTEENAALTFHKAKTLVSDGDTLFIKYGSIIRDICTFDTAIKGLKIDAYGNREDGNPMFDNFITIDSSNIERVEGYKNIYRIEKAFEAGSGTTTNMQLFVDGSRLGTFEVNASGYATISGSEITSFRDAMDFLSANVNEVWFSGYENGRNWTSGTYYFYFSLEDNPSNHKIEITNHVVNCLLDMYRLIDADINHVNTRGSAGKDGWNIGTNTFMEDCHIYDHSHHGFLSFNGFQKMYNCSAESLSGAIGYQFHYFGTSDEIARNTENIYIDCVAISKNQLGSAFAGHMGSTNKKPYLASYIVGCYVEGCNIFISGCKNINTVYAKSNTVKDVYTLCGAENKAIIDGIKGTLYASNKGSLLSYNFNGKVKMLNVILQMIVNNGIGGIVNIENSEPGAAISMKDCMFMIYKLHEDKINPMQTQWLFTAPQTFSVDMKNCVIAVGVSQELRYGQILAKNVKLPITMKQCLNFGFENNSAYKDNTACFDSCEFGLDKSMMNEYKYIHRLMYIDNGMIKKASLNN